MQTESWEKIQQKQFSLKDIFPCEFITPQRSDHMSQGSQVPRSALFDCIVKVFAKIRIINLHNLVRRPSDSLLLSFLPKYLIARPSLLALDFPGILYKFSSRYFVLWLHQWRFIVIDGRQSLPWGTMCGLLYHLLLAIYILILLASCCCLNMITS